MNHNIISESSENYLEVIYELGLYKDSVRLTDVATRMNVSKASVNKAIGILKQAGLAAQKLYGSIELTPVGKIQAEQVMQRHSKIRSFFIDVLGVPFEEADKDACRIEHVVSQKTMEKWAKYIDELLQQ